MRPEPGLPVEVVVLKGILPRDAIDRVSQNRTM